MKFPLASCPTSVRLLITLAVVALIVVLSVTPGQSRSGDSVFVWLVAATPTMVQKIMHLVAYGSIAFLWSWTLSSIESRPLRLTLALALTIGIGAALEWFQTMVPGRFGTAIDVILNSVGALLGLALALVLL